MTLGELTFLTLSITLVVNGIVGNNPWAFMLSINAQLAFWGLFITRLLSTKKN